MSHKQTPPKIDWYMFKSAGANGSVPTARFIGGAWHSFDCMCPICLQAEMDTANGDLGDGTGAPNRCECGSQKTGAPGHSSWCPLYTGLS